MARIIYATLMVVGGIVLTFALIIGGIMWALAPSTKAMPERIVLQLDLRQSISEGSHGGELLDVLGPHRPGLMEIVSALLQARTDKRVVGLMVLTGDAGMGIAHIQELREAVAGFRSSGKFAYAFAETFGESGDGLRPFYMASAAQEIWLQPTGLFAATGLLSQTPFVKQALDKLGISVEAMRRHEFKTAPNSATEPGFTPAHRENMQQLVESLYRQIVEDVARARGLSAPELRKLIDSAPLSASDAKVAKLVDRIAYRDEIDGYIESKVGKGYGYVSVVDYGVSVGPYFRKGPAIALIRGQGAIMLGKGGSAPLDGGPYIGTETIIKAFRDASDDDEVRAVVFRIDSPGGSYVASDAIWREVARTSARGKPVIVSMANVAGSGGYFVAMKADLIVASPGTITGSIGVFGGKPVAAALLDNIGVNIGEIKAGANADMWSMARRFTPDQLDRLSKMLDRIYADFIKKVGEARKLNAQQVDQVARGRVFTGADAKRLGLIDEVGGIVLAIGYAKAAVGIEPNADISIKSFPRPQNAATRLLARLLDSGAESHAGLGEINRGISALGRELRDAGVFWRGEILSMPPLPGLIDLY